MPWKDVSLMSARSEFLEHARRPGANITRRAERFGISRKTANKWLARERQGLPVRDAARAPHSSPRRTPPELEARALALRRQHPAWGGRKLRALLRDQSPETPSPSASTIPSRTSCSTAPRSPTSPTAGSGSPSG